MVRFGLARILAALLGLACVSSALAGEASQHSYKVQDLGTLGGPRSEALGINNHGQIVGRAATAKNAEGDDGVDHAFLYEGGKMKNLGVLPGSDSSEATGINNHGVIIGISYSYAGCLVYNHPFRYSNDRMVGLYLSDAGIVTPLGINDSGHFTGLCNRAGYIHGFYHNGWTTDLGALNGKADQRSEAFAINNKDEVVGVSWISNMDNVRAFVWRDCKMINLGTLPGHYCSEAHGINNKGEIVGWSAAAYDVIPDPCAFLYANGKMIDLNTLLPRGSGWVLKKANGINDAGQIVGMGLYCGSERAFLLSPASSK